TLHYYDEIGLLIPSYVAENAYRYYEEKELAKLQQILFFKELDFTLEDIIGILENPDLDHIEALRSQKKLLEAKQKRLQKLLVTIDKTIQTMKGGGNMQANDMFDPFTDEELDKLKEEARERWGESEAYKQSVERTRHWTKEDYDRIKKEGLLFTQ